MSCRVRATAGRVATSVVGAIAVLLVPALSSRAADVPDGLAGTWGLPPIDDKPGNYSFGDQERHGTCTLTDNRLVFIGEDRGFSYVEPGDRERDAEGAGPFANLCRIDLARTKDGLRVALRGVGCANGCTEAQFPGLAGEYHPRPQPSFACPPETSDLAWDEENLCLDPELAALDREMASAFGKAKAAASGAAQTVLVRAQRAWIAARRSGCDGGHRRTCLVEAYRKRLQELQ